VSAYSSPKLLLNSRSIESTPRPSASCAKTIRESRLWIKYLYDLDHNVTDNISIDSTSMIRPDD
jgi:hypothetical protein